MAIWLDVNPRSGVPLYIQIMQQIKHAIEVGALQPGEQLPTVRQLATELTIAPNTIVKAYNELQDLDLIESRAGVGTVVSSHTNGSVRKEQHNLVFERLRAVIRDSASLEIPAKELVDRFQAEIDTFYQQRGT